MPGSALAYDSTSHHGGEQTEVGLVGRRVVDLGKDFPATGARGENLGLIKLDAEATEALRRRAEAIIASGDEKVWVTEAVRSILAEVPVTGVNVAGLPWAEIDFPYDLEQARKVVWPAIERLSHPCRRLLRKLRWPAAVAAVLTVVALVWFSSALVGPASIDWETLAPEQGTRVRIQRAERGPQKWWLLRPQETLTVAAEGGPIRIEARPAFPAGAADTVAFAIAVSVNGVPYAYIAERAGVDPEVTYVQWRLGERERDEFVLPPGQYTVTLDLVRGNVGTVLVRVR